MTKKKILALLTVLSCIASMATMPTSAEFAVLPDGTWVEVTTSPFAGIMIETDGTELTQDMVDDVEGFEFLQTYESFTKTYCWGNYVTNIKPESTAFMLSTEKASPDLLTKIGRELTMKHDCITNVHLVEQSCYRYPRVTHTFSIKMKTQDLTFNETDFPEFAGSTIYGSNGSYTVTLPQDKGQEMLETYTQYQLYCYYKEFADEMKNKYAEQLGSVSALYKINASNSNNTAYSAFSVWDTAGDSNTDGAVDASDAADVLTIAAQNGTGAGIKATSANDVNADGNVDASDAAAVLCYSAAQGTGAEVSWVDILRK